MFDNILNDINLNLYRTFYAVALSKTISEAAEKLNISQSGISKSVKNLEEILNTKLFERTNTGVKLTKDGKELLEYVKVSFNNIIIGHKIIQSNQDLEHGTLTIGAQAHIASFYLLKKIKKFREVYPDINVKIISGSTSYLVEELLQHNIDFIIDSSPLGIKNSSLNIESLSILETCFIANSNEKLTENKTFDQFNYIMPLKRSSMRKALDNQLKELNIKLPVVLEVETTDLIVQSVKQNIGVGYVIKEAVSKELETGELIEIQTNLKLTELSILLIFVKEYASKIAQNFINSCLKK